MELFSYQDLGHPICKRKLELVSTCSKSIQSVLSKRNGFALQKWSPQPKHKRQLRSRLKSKRPHTTHHGSCYPPSHGAYLQVDLPLVSGFPGLSRPKGYQTQKHSLSWIVALRLTSEL
eukprot:6028557-Amphidinium_carterae.1